eukprot:1915476-Prymnesium_polylepis.1
MLVVQHVLLLVVRQLPGAFGGAMGTGARAGAADLSARIRRCQRLPAGAVHPSARDILDDPCIVADANVADQCADVRLRAQNPAAALVPDVRVPIKVRSRPRLQQMDHGVHGAATAPRRGVSAGVRALKLIQRVTRDRTRRCAGDKSDGRRTTRHDALQRILCHSSQTGRVEPLLLACVCVDGGHAPNATDILGGPCDVCDCEERDVRADLLLTAHLYDPRRNAGWALFVKIWAK